MVLFFPFKLFLMTLTWGGGMNQSTTFTENKNKRKNVIDLFFLLKGKDTDWFWHQSLTSFGLSYFCGVHIGLIEFKEVSEHKPGAEIGRAHV